MRAGLLKPKSLSANDISSRLKILNNYLTSFPSPDNKSLSQGDMIEIVLSMLLAVYISSMTIAGLESREKSYKYLIKYLVKLEVSPLDEPIPKKDNSKDSSPDTSIFKKEKMDTKQVKFGNEAKEHQQKSCGRYKAIKELDDPAWKIRDTSDYHSKNHYRKRVVSSRNSGEQQKKNTSKATRLVIQLKMQLKGRLKGVMLGPVVQISLTDCCP